MAALDGVASVIAQTDGLAVLRISGPRARDVFAKGLPIDLDPRAFAVDDVASSILAHIAVTIWRVDETLTMSLSLAVSPAISRIGWWNPRASSAWRAAEGQADYRDSVET